MNMVTLFAPGFENNREQLEKQAGEQTAALFKEDLVKALKEAGFQVEFLQDASVPLENFRIIDSNAG